MRASGGNRARQHRRTYAVPPEANSANRTGNHLGRGDEQKSQWLAGTTRKITEAMTRLWTPRRPQGARYKETKFIRFSPGGRRWTASGNDVGVRCPHRVPIQIRSLRWAVAERKQTNGRTRGVDQKNHRQPTQQWEEEGPRLHWPL